MICAIDLSNITFNPSIQIIRFFKEYKETNPGSQTFFNTDARDFDILRHEPTMLTPGNIFFNRKGELVCVNNFVNPLRVFKRTTAMMLAA
ncbi:hypothetical protein PYY25_001863 [Campylobacter coli]|nr:hypothetical protein [Campylobacter coli]